MSTLTDIMNTPEPKPKKSTQQTTTQVTQTPTPVTKAATETKVAATTTAPVTQVPTTETKKKPTSTLDTTPTDATIKETTKESVPTKDVPTEVKPLTFTEMAEKLYGEYKPQTPEEKAAEDKRNKREALFNAIGDGLSALSNMYFTTQGAPNMYNPASSLSANQRKRYDQLKAERDANKKVYMDAMLRARAADDANARADRTYNMQLEQMKEAREERKANREMQERFHKDQLDYQDKSLAATIKAREDSNANERARIEAYRGNRTETQIRKLRGRRFSFNDGTGKNKIHIWENTWRNSMPILFKMLVNAGVGRKKNGNRIESDILYQGRMFSMSPQEMNAFVQQHWSESDQAKAKMVELAMDDPAEDIIKVEYGDNSVSADDSSDNVASSGKKDDSSKSQKENFDDYVIHK